MDTKIIFGTTVFLAFLMGGWAGSHQARNVEAKEVVVDERTEQEKRALHAVEVQVDGYWCIVGYFGIDAKPVSIDCK